MPNTKEKTAGKDQQHAEVTLQDNQRTSEQFQRQTSQAQVRAKLSRYERLFNKWGVGEWQSRFDAANEIVSLIDEIDSVIVGCCDGTEIDTEGKVDVIRELAEELIIEEQICVGGLEFTASAVIHRDSLEIGKEFIRQVYAVETGSES